MGFVNMMDYMRIGADADPQGQVPPKTAQQQSSRLLSNVVVLEAVAELVQERSGRAKVTGEWRAGVTPKGDWETPRDPRQGG